MTSLLALVLLVTVCSCSRLPSTPEEIDCSACGDDLCWYDYDIERDGYVAHCAPWPDQCTNDRSCECLDSETDANGLLFCDQFGVSRSDACDVIDGRLLIYCETNLG